MENQSESEENNEIDDDESHLTEPDPYISADFKLIGPITEKDVEFVLAIRDEIRDNWDGVFMKCIGCGVGSDFADIGFNLDNGRKIYIKLQVME